MLPVVPAVAVEPAVRRPLHAGRARFHVFLRVEVAPHDARCADRMNRGEALRVPQRLERREPRVESEIAVQVEDITLGYGDAGPFSVIDRIAMRHDHGEPVDSAPLEQTHQDWAAARETDRRKPMGGEGRSGESQASGLHEVASRDRHGSRRPYILAT